MNYLLIVEYDGTTYSGWQKQPGKKRTIQGELEKAAEVIFSCPVALTGAGRTDKGVHAIGQVVTFMADKVISPYRLVYNFNGVLPDDIAVVSCKSVTDNFNARYSAQTKIYQYRIWNRENRSVWTNRYSWHVPAKLDIAAMREAASLLLGERDFSSFAAAGGSQKNMVVDMKRIRVLANRGGITVSLEADRFLYKMVRNIVGTLVEAGRHRISPSRVAEILDQKKRMHAGPTAPARGLFLKQVVY